MNTQVYRIENLLGVDEAYRARPDSAELVVNMRLDALGAWNVARGYHTIFRHNAGGSNPFVSNNVLSVETMHWFSQHNGGIQYLVWEHIRDNGEVGCDLVYLEGNQQTYTAIMTGRTFHEAPWTRTMYAAYAGWLYFINGYDEPSRWNGVRRTRIGFDRRPPPPRIWDLNNQPAIDWLAVAGDESIVVASGGTDGMAGGGSAGGENREQARGLGTRPTNGANPSTTFWTYGYAYTWVNDLGHESEPSPMALVTGENVGANTGNPIIGAIYDWSGGGKKGVAVEITDVPSYVRGVRVYRTENMFGLSPADQRNQRLYLHSEVAAGMGFFIHDLKPDYELGRELDSSTMGSFPIGAKLIAFFKNTMFLAGMPEDPSALRYSAPVFTEQFPANNIIAVGDGDAGEITGLYPTSNALVVFKRRGIYLIKGDTVNGFFAQTLTEDVGCAAPRTVVEIPGEGLLFVSDAGIYILKGALENTGTPTGVLHIGGKVQRTFDRRVNKTALVSAFALVNHRDKEVWIQLPTWSNYRPNYGIVYHYTSGQWSYRENWELGCGVESRDHRGYQFFGTNNTDDPGVVVYTGGTEDKGTSDSVLGTYRSSWVNGGSQMARVSVTGVDPFVEAVGNRNLTLKWRLDRREGIDDATGEVRTQVDTEYVARPLWGTAVWSTTETFADYVFVPLPFALYQSSRPTEFQWQLESTKMKLAGVDLRLPKDGGNIPKLDAALGADRR